MHDSELRRKIEERFRTQELFSVVSGIPEAMISKYSRGIRKPSARHQAIIDELLSGGLAEAKKTLAEWKAAPLPEDVRPHSLKERIDFIKKREGGEK